ncbi:MAG TPA: hypothetical protein VN631_03485 [Negativicutes bacterium]|nr:hypothetical protein [Negativicutes bacterium]
MARIGVTRRSRVLSALPSLQAAYAYVLCSSRVRVIKLNKGT